MTRFSNSCDNYLTLNFNSKNFDLNFIETISKINFSSIELIFFSDIPSIVPSKLFDKKYIVLICIGMVGLLSPAAFIFYNLGLTPEKGTYELVFFISTFLLVLITFNIMGIMVRDSMVGDIADEVELQSGRRQEGILFAAVGFMQKLNAGLGTFFAGQVLNFINFDRLNHTAEQAYTLAFVQGPVTTLLMILPIIIFSFYSLSAKKHRQILREIG